MGNWYFISWTDLLSTYAVYVDLVQGWLQEPGNPNAMEGEQNGVPGVLIALNSTTDNSGTAGIPDFLESGAQGGFTPSQDHGGT